jgi:L-asparaginase/Glu-tRNA(Gln) amidotransferase subunit D
LHDVQETADPAMSDRMSTVRVIATGGTIASHFDG